LTALFLFEQLWPGFSVSDARLAATVLTITATATAVSAACPTCGIPTVGLHSHSIRSPRDLPISGYTLQLRLHVRRFRCLNASCPRATFAERLPLLPAWAQQTARRRERVQALALALSAEAGARLTQPLQLATSPATLIGTVRQITIPATPAPRQIGLDDWALRKGRVYGTIIVDLAQHRPIDLLPDRRATTVAHWLQAHPSVELVARDRRTEYSRGSTDGAPQAIPVADRWHLLANMRVPWNRSCVGAIGRSRRCLVSRLMACPAEAAQNALRPRWGDSRRRAQGGRMVTTRFGTSRPPDPKISRLCASAWGQVAQRGALRPGRARAGVCAAPPAAQHPGSVSPLPADGLGGGRYEWGATLARDPSPGLSWGLAASRPIDPAPTAGRAGEATSCCSAPAERAIRAVSFPRARLATHTAPTHMGIGAP
jgi:hypothetical protein